MSAALPELSYAAWEPTKTTLHLFTQVAGKIRLACVPLQNHWWNVTLYPNATGLTTGLMRFDDTLFEIAFDLTRHRLVVSTGDGKEQSFKLRDGLSVRKFYRKLFDILRSLGIGVKIIAKPYGVPITTPFDQDDEHHTYDRKAVERWNQVNRWSADVFRSYASDFAGKASPAHLFWHSFDLAMGRYNGKLAPPKPAGTNNVEREAYSHEVIAVGFWPGDAKMANAAYYTYTAPEPATLTSEPLAAGGVWAPSGSGHMGVLPYDTVRASETPEATLLAFLRSGYAAGAKAAGWDVSSLAHDVLADHSAV